MDKFAQELQVKDDAARGFFVKGTPPRGPLHVLFHGASDGGSR
jgi:hypothetical protein